MFFNTKYPFNDQNLIQNVNQQIHLENCYGRSNINEKHFLYFVLNKKIVT